MEVRLLAVTSNVGNRGRALGVVIALAMVGALLSAQTAFGAGDPVASGTFAFKYSGGFKHQLKSNGVKLKPKKLKIKTAGSSLDPITGAGTLKLGKITFKKGNNKVVYNSAKATLGANGGKGNVKGSSGKLFSLKGGKVTRSGFGAKVSGVKVKLLKSAAKKINKALGLHSLHKGSAGTASANNVQPSTVTLVSGSSELVANLVTFAKFGHHCVSPVTTGTTGVLGIAPLAPATETPTPSFVFPVTGGSLSPAATSGTANASGGIQITQNILNDNAPTAGSLCNTIAGGTSSQVKQSDLVLDLNSKQIQAHIVISGTGVAALDGDKGSAFIGTIDMTGAAVTADPSTRKVTITNALAAFNATSALVLNGAFPCDANSGLDPTTGCTAASPYAFVAGDPIGTVSLSAQAQ